jgi:hypothetical protein
MVAYSYNPSTWEAEARRFQVQVQPRLRRKTQSEEKQKKSRYGSTLYKSVQHSGPGKNILWSQHRLIAAGTDLSWAEENFWGIEALCLEEGSGYIVNYICQSSQNYTSQNRYIYYI